MWIVGRERTNITKRTPVTRVRMMPLISSTDMSAFLHSPCSQIIALTRSLDGWHACSQDSWFWKIHRKTFFIEYVGIHWTQMLLITQFHIHIKALKVAASVVLWRPLLVNPATVSCNGFLGNSETACLVMYFLWWGVVDLLASFCLKRLQQPDVGV